jgi:hypothetical protein
MRVTWNRILILLLLGIFARRTWSDFSSGYWGIGACSGIFVVALIGLHFRKIWGKYLVYALASVGVLWVAYMISLEIISGRLFIWKHGLASDIGTVPATLLGLFSLAAVLFLSIGISLVAHYQYKKMEQDRHAEDDTSNSPSQPSRCATH